MFDLRQHPGSKLTYVDLFAGAGGLSEGFIRAGFEPIAHVEADASAAFTLRTREAYHRLRQEDDLSHYEAYISREASREQLYHRVFSTKPSCVVNAEIGDETLESLFSKIDELSNGVRPDVLIGGPPCQAYSLVGRARSDLRMVGDKRNYLFRHYAEFLDKYKPRFFVFENVTGLMSAREGDGTRYFDLMTSLFNGIGYSVEWRVLSADDYGVPQKRRRVIIVGRQGRTGGFFPELTPCKIAFQVKDAIGDLPQLKAGSGTPFITSIRRKPSKWSTQFDITSTDRTTTWHQARPHNQRDLAIFSLVVERWNKHRERLNYNDLPDHLKTHRNRDGFVDRFKVVASDLQASHTIVAHIAKDGNYYIHPDGSQNRSITPREAARLQTFPDNYYFEAASDKPSRTSAYRQIGNAVPVVLAENLANALLKGWS